MQNKMNHPMLIALEQAKLAFDEEEVPVGAVITASKTGILSFLSFLFCPIKLTSSNLELSCCLTVLKPNLIL